MSPPPAVTPPPAAPAPARPEATPPPTPAPVPPSPPPVVRPTVPPAFAAFREAVVAYVSCLRAADRDPAKLRACVFPNPADFGLPGWPWDIPRPGSPCAEVANVVVTPGGRRVRPLRRRGWR